MIEKASHYLAGGDRAFRGPLRLSLLTAVLALSACVSDADQRDGNPDSAPDVRSGADVKEGGASDSVRADAQDSALREDANDSGNGDASEESASDVANDVIGSDVIDAIDPTDVGDARGPDASDVATPPDVRDAVTDVGAPDADAGVASDALDTGTAVDANDSGTPIDVNDSSVPGDASDAANDGDANDGGMSAEGGDASDGAVDAGVVVIYQENFDTTLGTFLPPVAVCGSTVPQWSNNAGYAHASEPALTGISRISSPAVLVPANTSNVTLRMSHKLNIEQGWDAAHLLISINGATATQVTTFTSGGYVNGGQTNPANCALTNSQGMYPGWSGNLAEFVSTVNLSAAPFNVVPGSTITITFRMLTDDTQNGVGWDINWVTLSANSP